MSVGGAWLDAVTTTTSADGTPIAFHASGEGPVVVILGGAFSVASDGDDLARALVDEGFTAVTVDRRGRGGSGDRGGSTPDDEAADLAAVIAATGGDAAVLGHSSGALVAWHAATRGVPLRSLYLSEPPVRFGVDEPDPALADRLQALVDDGRADEAVAVFQREAVGLPDAMIEQIRQSEMFPRLVAVAPTLVYDTRVSALLSTPSAEALAVPAPVTVLRGAQTFPMLQAGADRLAAEMPGARLVIVPESVMHRPDPAATARVVGDGERMLSV